MEWQVVLRDKSLVVDIGKWRIVAIKDGEYYDSYAYDVEGDAFDGKIKSGTLKSIEKELEIWMSTRK